ncbi:MAG: hypothetical protein U0V87_05845 [Acidobacteriota bacterium]
MSSPLFTARWTKDAIREAFHRVARELPPVVPHDPDVVVDVRFERGSATIGLALGVESLHRRGFERRTRAPLREDIAAGIALLAEVDATKPLLDPFCGSATLLAEAAAVALRVPPRRGDVADAIAQLPAFSEVDADRIVEELRARRIVEHAPFFGYEADSTQLPHARRHLEFNDLQDDVRVAVGRVPELSVPGEVPAGLLLTNPPWGRWLNHDVETAWDGLGRFAKSQLAGWKMAVLSGSEGLTRGLRMKAERRYPLRIGSVDARLLLYQIRRYSDRQSPLEPDATAD